MTRTAMGFGIRILGGIAALGWQFTIVRTTDLPASDQFFLAVTLVMIAATFGRAGLDVVAYRSAATGRAGADFAVKTLRRVGTKALGVTTVATVVFAFVVAPWLFDETGLTHVLAVASLAIIPLGLVTIDGEALKAVGKVGRGAAFQSLVGPLTSLLILLAVSAVGWRVTGNTLALIFGGGILLAALLAWQANPTAHSDALPGTTRKALRTGFPIAVTATAHMAIGWSAIISLGVAGHAGDVATVFLADRVTSVGVILVTAVNAAIGAEMARAVAAGDTEAADKVRRRTQRYLLPLATVSAAAIFVIAPSIAAVAGDQFEQLVPVLRILMLGQVAVIAAGPSSMFLLMAHGQAAVGRVALVTLAAAVLLQAILVPSFGPAGAAWGISAAWLINRVLLSVAVRRRSIGGP